LNFGGFGTTVDEVTIKKNGCKVPKSIKLLVKGKDHVELVAEQVKETSKDTKQAAKPVAGKVPPAKLKPNESNPDNLKKN
jgi:hypothetical protein